MKATKKFLATSTAVIIAASAIVPAASAASFKDIKGNAHENAIISLADQGIIGGYPDGTFKPNQNLTRSDVVKLLGKYLVSLGHEIPTDYKTKMRFTDLTAKSQDELLQYAALVKDLGVFQGSAGQLLHKDQLRRDQMATVLVRAFKVIKEYDYVAPMNEAAYKSTITDLTKTTAEHQEAIKTLAYHGVTKQATFSPKDPTKRGQFASFLYNMLKVNVPKPAPVAPVEPPKPVLTIKTVEVQAADKLRVVLSDDKAYIVTLKTPLVENVETEVTFEIGDKSYTTKVKYEVPDLKVASIMNPNGGQIAITFNQPVKLDVALDQVAINKLVQVYGVDRAGQVALSKAQLSEDKKTLTVTVNATTGLEGRYRVVVDGIESVTAKKLTKYDEVVALIMDKTAPAIAKVENISATKVKVTFTEPVKKSFGTTMFSLANGTAVLNVKESAIENSDTEVIFDLSAATANGRILDPGTTVYVSFATILDTANNLSSPNPLTTYISKGNKDGVAPTLTNVTQLGAKKIKLTFAEEIRQPLISELVVAQGNSVNSIVNIEQDKADAKSYAVTTAATLNGYTTISTAPGSYITDLSGEMNVFSTAFNFVIDTNIPKVISTNVVKDQGVEYLEFTFDRNIETLINSKVAITGNYIYNNYTYPVTDTFIADIKKSDKQDNVARVRLSQLLNETDNKKYINHTFLVNATFTGVTSEQGLSVNDANNLTFTRSYDLYQTQDTLAVKSITTPTFPVKNGNIPNNTIVIEFNTNVDPATGTNKQNYSLYGVEIESANIKYNEPNKVYLEIKPGTIVYPRSENLIISNLKAYNSNVTMSTYTQLLPLNENIAPKITSVYSTTNNTISLSFSEAVTNVLTNAFDIYVGNTKAVNPVIIPVNKENKEFMILISEDIKSNGQVTFIVNKDSTIEDLAGNKLEATSPLIVPIH